VGLDLHALADRITRLKCNVPSLELEENVTPEAKSATAQGTRWSTPRLYPIYSRSH
jgi:hypothetical protein